MCLGIGLVYWMVLEVFICCYIEKVDIFFLGVLFNVIFVWDFVFFNNEKWWYGVFVKVLGEVKIGFGYVMVVFGFVVMIEFIYGYLLNEENGFWILILDVLNYVLYEWFRVEEIYYRIEEIVISIWL